MADIASSPVCVPGNAVAPATEPLPVRVYKDALTALGGTPDDWKRLREKAAALTHYELAWWTQHLLPVLDQLVAASEGNPDPDFWKSFYKWNAGSGGVYITGHIINFFPYFGKGKTPQAQGKTRLGEWLRAVFARRSRPQNPLDALMQQVKAAPPDKRNALLVRAMTGVSVPSATTLCRRNPYLGGPNAPHWDQPFAGMTAADLLTSYSRVPFTWKHLDTELPMEFVAGFFGATQDPTTLAIRPEIGWVVREKETPSRSDIVSEA